MIRLTNSEKFAIRKEAMINDIDDDLAIVAVGWLIDNDLFEWSTVREAIDLYERKLQESLNNITFGWMDLMEDYE